MGAFICRTPLEAITPRLGPAGAATVPALGLAGLALWAAPATSFADVHCGNEETAARRAAVIPVCTSAVGMLPHLTFAIYDTQQEGILSRRATGVNYPWPRALCMSISWGARALPQPAVSWRMK
jgi:hypothetical protein